MLQSLLHTHYVQPFICSHGQVSEIRAQKLHIKGEKAILDNTCQAASMDNTCQAAVSVWSPVNINCTPLHTAGF